MRRLNQLNAAYSVFQFDASQLNIRLIKANIRLNVSAKTCLHCQILYKPKKILPSAQRPRYEYIFPVKSRKIEEMTKGDKEVNYSFFSFLYLLSPCSARLCAPCALSDEIDLTD